MKVIIFIFTSESVGADFSFCRRGGGITVQYISQISGGKGEIPHELNLTFKGIMELKYAGLPGPKLKIHDTLKFFPKMNKNIKT